MATMTPRFKLPLASPEIVFVADQSGSMSGSKNASLVVALKVFLKSLPFGVRFNICAFGSGFDFVFESSQPYTEKNVDKAMQYVSVLSANHGGTELLEPMKEVFKRRLGDLPLEIMVLTDGEIWEEIEVFDYINKEIQEDQVDARIFTLGIGTDVSHTLVEGIARAGNGFAQFVANEQTDAKLVRMLRASLFPHLKNAEFSVNFDNRDHDGEDEDFEIVEKIEDCLVLDDNLTEQKSKATTSAKAPTSFFDQEADTDAQISKESGQRYSHLPPISVPKIFQAPSKVPPILPSNRTTLYLMLGPDAPRKKAVSVTLRARAATGPIELTIPLRESTNMAPVVHQLAARRVIQELEEGRGWIQQAKSTDGQLIKNIHQNRIDEIVEREAVRLGETFQVAGKWCSFVAVNEHDGSEEAQVDEVVPPPTRIAGSLAAAIPPPPAPAPLYASSGTRQSNAYMPAPVQAFASATPAFRTRSLFKARSSVGDQAPQMQLASMAARDLYTMTDASTSPLSSLQYDSLDPTGTMECAAIENRAGPPDVNIISARSAFLSSTDDMLEAETGDDLVDSKLKSSVEYRGIADGGSPAEVARSIISFQAFQGSWSASEDLLKLIGENQARLDELKADSIAMTALVIEYLRKHLESESEMWDLVVDKAEGWLESQKSGHNA